MTAEDVEWAESEENRQLCHLSCQYMDCLSLVC